MTTATFKRILAIGTITGMRSMAGAATLAAQRDGLLKSATAVLAMGEMAADKTTAVGNRTDTIPLTGRAVMGALLGGLIAREQNDGILLGAALGAGTAVLAAHLAYQIRTHLPLPPATSGMLEDAIVVIGGMQYARRF